MSCSHSFWLIETFSFAPSNSCVLQCTRVSSMSSTKHFFLVYRVNTRNIYSPSLQRQKIPLVLSDIAEHLGERSDNINAKQFRGKTKVYLSFMVSKIIVLIICSFYCSGWLLSNSTCTQSMLSISLSLSSGGLEVGLPGNKQLPLGPHICSAKNWKQLIIVKQYLSFC